VHTLHRIDVEVPIGEHGSDVRVARREASGGNILRLGGAGKKLVVFWLGVLHFELGRRGDASESAVMRKKHDAFFLGAASAHCTYFFLKILCGGAGRGAERRAACRQPPSPGNSGRGPPGRSG